MSPASYEFLHAPVLLAETLAGLNIRPDGTYVDCTVGGAGHSAEIYRRLDAAGRLIALDRDPSALQAAEDRLRAEQTARGEHAAALDLVHSDFASLGGVLRDLGIGSVDGILADLGVSSPQLDHPERGFSYQLDGPLDMRMDPTQGRTAADLVNQASQDELRLILSRYGEERHAARIAEAIVRRRVDQPFTRTTDLADVIIAAQPAKARREKQHPAKRSFQAIRIAVNEELSELEDWLEAACSVLNDGGRLAAISFHSLEDRLIKRAYRRWEDPCICPPGLPHVCGREPLGTAVNRGGETAGEEELETNPRSRSARLRVFERNSTAYYDTRTEDDA